SSIDHTCDAIPASIAGVARARDRRQCMKCSAMTASARPTSKEISASRFLIAGCSRCTAIDVYATRATLMMIMVITSSILLSQSRAPLHLSRQELLVRAADLRLQPFTARLKPQFVAEDVAKTFGSALAYGPSGVSTIPPAPVGHRRVNPRRACSLGPPRILAAGGR